MGRERIAGMVGVCLSAAGALAILLVSLVPPAAQADQAYHTHHYAFTSVSGASLRSGFVENIHANGPNVYAHEIYMLNGAAANASYRVVLSIWASNLTCSGTPDLRFQTAVLTTNRAGNGIAQHVFSPQDADGLRGHTVSAMWQLLAGSSVIYQTRCETITLD